MEIEIEKDEVINVNYNSTKNNILNQINNLHKNINNESNEDLFKLYMILIRIRHDIIHYSILNSLGLDWKDEEKIGDIFHIISDEHWVNQTPDIVLKSKEDEKSQTYYIIEISVSIDLATSEEQKIKKYSDLLLNLKARKYDVIFIHINLKPSYSNLEFEINKICNYMELDFDYMFVNNVSNILEEQKQWLSKFIDKEYFEKMKLEQFAPTLYENIGMYNDLTLDTSVFVEYNSKFNHINEVENCINKIDEDSFINYFKNILEDSENDIYKKYQDGRLGDHQFDNAKIRIQTENSMRVKQKTKPTHHIIIPMFEEIEQLKYDHTNGKLDEQKMILNFANYIKENKPKIQDDYYVFVYEISCKLVNMFTDNNKNKKINDEIFKTGTYIHDGFDTRELFNIYKYACEILNFYYSKDYKNLKKKKFLSKKAKKFFNVYEDTVTEEFINDLELKLKSFNLYDKINKLNNNYSYYDFLIEMDYYQPESEKFDKIDKTKTMFCTFNDVSETTKQIWYKTGIDYFKNQPDVKKSNVEETIDFEEKVYIDQMLIYLKSKPVHQHIYKNDDYFLNYPTFDSDECKKMKNVMNEEYNVYFEKIKDTNAYYYLYKSHDIVTQLLHFTTLNLKNRTFSFFNTGIPNMLYVVAGCYNKLFSENGKPFMIIVITKNPDYYTPFFGKIRKYQIDNENYLIISNWRRLQTSKLTHIKDSYYSVLSSTMNSMMSLHNKISVVYPNKYEYIFSLRAIISLSTTQKISELLMDTRYAYMSALSLYTNIDRLLYEKFGPPYKNCLEVWVVDRLITRLKLLNDSVKNESIKLNIPEYISGRRNLESTGGVIELPSLWGDYLLIDVNEILDETFLYVHTPKEPSNVFHEQVKALKTIIKYQDEFDNLPKIIREGSMETLDDINNYLRYDTQIGSCAQIIFYSTNYTLNLDKPNMKKIIHQINDEDISEIISTKAVIKDLNREVTSDKKPTKREYTKFVEKIKRYYGDTSIDTIDFKKFFLKTDSQHYSIRKTRQKVFETTLDYIESYEHINKTVDMANHFIKEEKGKVIADICIKSQYGSKREFYVINFGAKALARCSENFFKKVCEQTNGEAISIPGDKKLLSMQQMLDRLLLNIPSMDDYKIMFTNGDCTKWSAAETMSSFIAMTRSFKDRIGENMYNLLLSVFNSWSNKSIQIPIDILNKVIPPMSEINSVQREKLKYLLMDISRNHGVINSTQNFLQGMFNYASSFKAICCLNYTYYVWKKIYGDTSLIVEHMAHSDDYVTVILYKDIRDFEKFRVLQKIMMRLHGYNDSERKTNCQNVFMEFVSLMSFNGIMLYPQIKKSKEINTNLPCIGYKQDIESAMSRTSECLRVGCNLSFCYFFERLHTICIADAYSLLPNMTNNCGRSFEELMNTPVELFGIPDMNPMFLLFCRGSGNNYRLYKYGSTKQKFVIEYLYDSSKSQKEKEKYVSEDKDYSYSLLTPIFLYDTENKSLKRLRNSIKWEPYKCTDFWDNHISYRFLKPRSRTLLISWIKSMFFNRTFVEAYTKANRTKMTMRLSSFVKNMCVKTAIEIEEYFDKKLLNQNKYTINQYITNILNDIDNKYRSGRNIKLNDVDITQINKIITKCDPTYSTIYSILTGLTITETLYQKKQFFQIATKSPQKIRSFELINTPEVLIQFLYNPQDSLIDKRFPKSNNSLEKDVVNIKKRINSKFLESKNTLDILTVFNDMSITKEKPVIMMGYNHLSKQIIYVIRDILQYNYIPFRYCDVTIHGITKVVDPFTGDLLYIKGEKMTQDLHIHSLENICLLYVYYVIKKNKTTMKFKSIIQNLQFIIDREKKIKKNYIDVLRQFTRSYCQQFEIPNYLIRIASYLKSVLIGENDLLDDMINSAYSYSFKFISDAKHIGRKYEGRSIFVFSHFKTQQKVISYESKKQPLIIYEKIRPNLLSVHYNISMLILGYVSENEFHHDLYKTRYSLIKLPFKDDKELNKFVKDEKILYAYTIDSKQKIHQVKSEDIDLDDEFIPFFQTKKSLYFDKGNNKKIGKLYATINEKKLIVNVGKQKAFMLPFWRCECTNNVEWFNTSHIIYDDGYDIVDFFFNNTLKKYLTDNLKQHIYPKNKIDYDKIRDDILNNIPKNRLYWWNHDDILNQIVSKNIDTEYLCEILNLKKKGQYSTPYKYDPHFFKKTNYEEEIHLDQPAISDIIEPEIDIKDSKTEKTIDELKLDFNNMMSKLNLLDDFLVEREEIDEEIYDKSMFDDEDDYILHTPSVSKEKLLSMTVFEFNISDNFIVKPTKPKYDKNLKYISKVNYLLNKIYHLPNLSTCSIINDISNYQTHKNITIFDYIYGLELFCKQHEKIMKIKDIDQRKHYQLIELVFIYKLMCESYIKPIVNNQFSFSISYNQNLIYKINFNEKYNDELYNKLKNNKNVNIINLSSDIITFEIKTDLFVFLKKRSQNIPNYSYNLDFLKTNILNDYFIIQTEDDLDELLL